MTIFCKEKFSFYKELYSFFKNRKQVALCFPGQGSQFVDMGMDLYNSHDESREIFDQADEYIKKHAGWSLLSVIADEDLLSETLHSQVSIFVTSIAFLQRFYTILPDMFANELKDKYVNFAELFLDQFCANMQNGIEETFTEFHSSRYDLQNTQDCENSLSSNAYITINSITERLQKYNYDKKSQCNTDFESESFIRRCSEEILEQNLEEILQKIQEYSNNTNDNSKNSDILLIVFLIVEDLISNCADTFDFSIELDDEKYIQNTEFKKNSTNASDENDQSYSDKKPLQNSNEYFSLIALYYTKIVQNIHLYDMNISGVLNLSSGYDFFDNNREIYDKIHNNFIGFMKFLAYIQNFYHAVQQILLCNADGLEIGFADKYNENTKLHNDQYNDTHNSIDIDSLQNTRKISEIFSQEIKQFFVQNNMIFDIKPALDNICSLLNSSKKSQYSDHNDLDLSDIKSSIKHKEKCLNHAEQNQFNNMSINKTSSTCSKKSLHHIDDFTNLLSESVYASGMDLVQASYDMYTKNSSMIIDKNLFALINFFLNFNIVFCGHSLGEYSALCAAGVINFFDGISILAERSKLMSESAYGAMVAVLNADDKVDGIIQHVLRDNLNSDSQQNDIFSCVSSNEVSCVDSNDLTKRCSSSNALYSTKCLSNHKSTCDAILQDSNVISSVTICNYSSNESLEDQYLDDKCHNNSVQRNFSDVNSSKIAQFVTVQNGKSFNESLLNNSYETAEECGSVQSATKYNSYSLCQSGLMPENNILSRICVKANENCNGQVVLSGDVDSIQGVINYCSQNNIKAIKLNVSGGFHSPLMAKAESVLQNTINEKHFFHPVSNFFSSSTFFNKISLSGDKIKNNIKHQMTHGVNWRNLMDSLTSSQMTNAGESMFLEIGPGKVLSNLAKKHGYVNINISTSENDAILNLCKFLLTYSTYF